MAIRVQMSEKATVPATIRLIRLLVKLLVLSLALPELRLGTSGFFYPKPTIIGQAATGAPFFIEVIVIAIVMLFLLAFMIQVVRIEMRWYHGITLLLIAFAFLGLAIPEIQVIPTSGSTFGYVRITFETLGLFFAIVSIPWRRKDLLDITRLFIFVGVFHAALIFISFLIPYESVPDFFNIIESTPFRYSGIFVQASRAAVLLVVSLAILLQQVLSLSSLSVVAFVRAGFFSLIVVIGILLAQTRASYVAIAGVIFLFFLENRQRRLSTVLLVVSASAALVLVLSMFGVLEIGLSRLGESGSATESGELLDEIGDSRGFIWEVAFQAMIDYPFGLGYGTLDWYATDLVLPHAHNMYLQTGVQSGALSMILLIYLHLRGLLWSKRKLTNGADPEFDTAVNGLRLGVVAFIIAGQFEPFLVTNTGHWFWALFGILMAPVEMAPAESPEPPPETRLLQPAALKR